MQFELTVETSHSNPFARAISGKTPVGAAGRVALVALGVVLTLVLVGCLAMAIYLFGSLVSRGALRGDVLALFAASLVGGMTYVMARGRRR